MSKKGVWIKNKKEEWSNTLAPLKSKKIRKFDFVGFDIETHTEKNIFLMGGLYYYKGYKERQEVYKVFYDREEMINFIFENKKYFQRRYFVATNLEFDFTVLFKGTKHWNKFNLLYRGASLIMCKEKVKRKHGAITFIDTMNYMPFGVGKWGKILGYDKLEMPISWEKKYFVKNNEEEEFKITSSSEGYDIVLNLIIPRKPKNQEEIKNLNEYNKRDCKISCDAMYLLQKGFNKLGGQMKITSASSSTDIFRRQFLDKKLIKESYVTKNSEITNFIFKSYYGGRTEVFKKGEYENLFYYDINSLYPSVMRDFKIPLPQSVEIIRSPQQYFIYSKMGVSECIINVPETLDKPILPVRHEGKLIFPVGTIKGVWTHEEIRKALTLGCNIVKIKEQIVYHKGFSPFKNFIDYLYNLRLEQKKNKDPLQQATKLVMNSLYGKFGMRKVTKTKIIQHQDATQEFLEKELKGKDWKIQGDCIVYREEELYNGKYQFPIIASYITAYARLRMYDYIAHESVIYTDTDSIVTTKNLKINYKDLGKMKLEGTYRKGFFVRPKFYMLLESEDGLKDEVKIKGIARANKNDFDNILKAGVVDKWKFNRLRESLIQNKEVNAVSVVTKQMGLDDNKRAWHNATVQSESKPLKLNMNEEEV